MITYETAVKIAHCHKEIENSIELLAGLDEELRKNEAETEPSFHNAFGERIGLQLGVPSGPSSHRLFKVSPDLSKKVIQEHIDAQHDRLAELMEEAQKELKGEKKTPYIECGGEPKD